VCVQSNQTMAAKKLDWFKIEGACKRQTTAFPDFCPLARSVGPRPNQGSPQMPVHLIAQAITEEYGGGRFLC
jgi:hypothetical protein